MQKLLIALLITLFLLPIYPVAAIGPVGYGAHVTVLRTDEASIDLRIETGRPGAANGWLLAAPPQSTAILELLAGKAGQPPIAVTGQGWLRDQWILRLSLVAPANQPATAADVRVHFLPTPTPPESFSQQASADADPWFESVLAGALLNQRQGWAWRQRPPATPDSPAAQAFYPQQARLRLTTLQAGIHRLSGADLLAAGWPEGWLATAGFRLSGSSGDWPLHVADGGDGRLHEEDYLEFYAAPAATASRYSAANIYWLDYEPPPAGQEETEAGTAGQRLEAAGAALTPSAFPALLHLEENLIYDSALASWPASDGWHWQRLSVRPGGRQARTFPFTLTQPVDDGLDAVLSLKLLPIQEPPFRLQIELNSQMVFDFLWDPDVGPLPPISFAEGLLRDGDNLIELIAMHNGSNSTQGLILDWIELRYSQRYVSSAGEARFSAPKAGLWDFAVSGFPTPDIAVYDLTHEQRPRRIDGFGVEPAGQTYTLRFTAQGSPESRFIAAGQPALYTPRMQLVTPSANLAPGNGADWIAILRPESQAALAPLVEQRRSQGLRTRLVDLQTVYDAYGAGLPEPAAISAFLADAYANWPGPAPAFVLLVGDGSYDPKGYLGHQRPLDIPPALADIDPIIGETADENSFAAIRGSDLLPDLAVGRLPVQSAEELAAVVAKIVAYENLLPYEPIRWPPRHFFLVDDPDTAGDFHILADAIATLLPHGQAVQEAYFGKVPYMTPQEIRPAAIDAINSGLLLLHYVGHGTIDAWGGERLLGPEHIGQLSNVGQAPPALSLSSLNGYFLEPAGPSFLEQMLSAPNGGISAYVASTGVGVSLGNQMIHQGFVQQALRRRPHLLGLGVVNAKLTLYATGPAYGQRLLQAFALFGDPAGRLPLAEEGLHFPLIDVGPARPAPLPLIVVPDR